MATKKTTTKKTTSKKAVEVKVEAPVVETPVVEAPVVEAPVVEEKVEVKEEVKVEAKKAPAKKAPAKKAPAKAETVITVQFAGNEVAIATVEEKVKAQFVAEGNKASAIKSLNIYVKPEEASAYYVINGDVTGAIEL